MKTFLLLLNGMISFPDTWSWQFAFLFFGLVVLFAPSFANTKVRYYACYVCYVFWVSTAAVLLTPYFIFRPRNIDNLRVAAKILKHLTKFLGIKWTVRNEHILKKKRGAVIAANHQSILDIEGMFNVWETMESCTAVAKKEILFVPPFGQVAWLAGLIYIDRSNPRAAFKTLQAASSLIHDLKAKLWLFPEGTRNKKADKLLPFKRGAFKMAIESRAPIIPVVFSPYYFIDGKNKTFDKGEIIISVLDEIPTEALKPEDVEDLMNTTYKLMETEYQKLRLEIDHKYHPKNNNKMCNSK